MTEMKMVRELRRVVATAAGQAGGNRENGLCCAGNWR